MREGHPAAAAASPAAWQNTSTSHAFLKWGSASRGGIAPASAPYEADLIGRATSGLVTCVADVSLNLAAGWRGGIGMTAPRSGKGTLVGTPHFGKPIRIGGRTPI